MQGQANLFLVKISFPTFNLFDRIYVNYGKQFAILLTLILKRNQSILAITYNLRIAITSVLAKCFPQGNTFAAKLGLTTVFD